jgi:hypothetical protein
MSRNPPHGWVSARQRFEALSAIMEVSSQGLGQQVCHMQTGLLSNGRQPIPSIAPSQRAFTAPKLFEHGDDNNQAGQLYFMIIGGATYLRALSGGFHELRIGWSQS